MFESLPCRIASPRAVHLQYMGQKFMKCWQWVRSLGLKDVKIFEGHIELY